MNEKAFLYSRCAVNTTCMVVGSADIAYVHGWTVVGQCICPWMDGSRTTQEQLSRSSCRGAAKRCVEEQISVVHATVNLEYRNSFSYVYLKISKGLLNNFKIAFQFPLRNMFAKFPFFPFTTRRKMFDKIFTKILSGHSGLFKTLCRIP